MICDICGLMEEKGNTFIADLEISKFFLNKKQNFHGRSMIIFNRHVEELEDLTEEEMRMFVLDVKKAALAIKKSLKPDKLNYSILGNKENHLHCHIYPRYKNDGRWGKSPFSDDVKLLTEKEYAELACKIRSELKDV